MNRFFVRNLVCGIAITSLAFCIFPRSISIAQDTNNTIKSVRIGIGYSTIGNSSILDQPLKLWNDGPTNETYSLSYPKECFSAPGINKMISYNREREISDSKALVGYLFYLGLSGADSTMTCGQSAVPAVFTIEGQSENEEWYVIQNPDSRYYNVLINLFYKNRTNDKESIKWSKYYGTESYNGNGKLSHSVAVRDEIIALYFSSEKKQFQNNLITFAKLLGYQAADATLPDQEDYRTVLVIGRLSPKNFYSEFRAVRDLIAKLGIPMLELQIRQREHDLGSRVIPNWINKLVAKVDIPAGMPEKAPKLPPEHKFFNPS
jgi:hypothetical protein